MVFQRPVATLGVATQFPRSQFYPNPTVKFEFYHAILIWNDYFIPILNMSLSIISVLKRVYFILAQKLNFIHLSLSKISFILLSRNCVATPNPPPSIYKYLKVVLCDKSLDYCESKNNGYFLFRP